VVFEVAAGVLPVLELPLKLGLLVLKQWIVEVLNLLLDLRGLERKGLGHAQSFLQAFWEHCLPLEVDLSRGDVLGLGLQTRFVLSSIQLVRTALQLSQRQVSRCLIHFAFLQALLRAALLQTLLLQHYVHWPPNRPALSSLHRTWLRNYKLFRLF